MNNTDVFEEKLDTIMTYTVLSDYAHIKGAEKVNPKNFPAAVVIGDRKELGHDMGVTDMMFFGDTQLKDISDLPPDFAIFRFNNKDDQSVDVAEYGVKSLYNVSHLHVMTMKEKRGFAMAHLPSVKEKIAIVNENGTYNTHVMYYANHGGIWKRFHPSLDKREYFLPHGIDTHVAERMPVLMGVAFTHQFYWHVEIGYEGLPQLSFPCSIEGARDVFRLRDIPEGKQRRTALKHWVREHWRQKRDTPDDDEAAFVRVMEHMRGATEFKWNGMRCIVKPSISDLRRFERLKAAKS